MDFDHSCFGRPLNDVLINSVMNRKFYKILDKLSNHLHLSVYCILDVFNLMIVNVLFFSDVTFFQLHVPPPPADLLRRVPPRQSPVLPSPSPQLRPKGTHSRRGQSKAEERHSQAPLPPPPPRAGYLRANCGLRLSCLY